jgi:exosortase K
VKLALLAAVALLALGLKHHYSVAGPDELAWILAPTAAAVELTTGVSFEREAGTGYLAREQMFLIAKSCAGVNFLIACLLASSFSFLGSRATLAGRLRVLLACAAGSYLCALLANTVRIAIALHLHGAFEPSGWLTRERVHRLEGIAVYALFLCLFYLAGRRLVGPRAPEGRPA